MEVGRQEITTTIKMWKYNCQWDKIICKYNDKKNNYSTAPIISYKLYLDCLDRIKNKN